MSATPIPYDPSDAITTDWRGYFLDHKDDLFSLQCEDGEAILNGRWMLLNIMLCMPLIKRRRPISRDKHLMLSGIYDAKAHAERETQIVRTLESYGYDRRDLGHDIIMTVNDAHNMCYTHLGANVCTMDILSMADTILQPEVEPVATMKYGNIEDRNIQRMQDDFKAQSKKITDLLKGDSLNTNIFRAPLLCGALKEKQFHQFVLSAGPRTDTDDSMFLRPVLGSFLGGMYDIQDLAIESRSASKATHYNKTQMPTTSYHNRKISIQSSVIANIYAGDCGSSVYIDYKPTEKTVKFLAGRFYVSGDGTLKELTEERYGEVVDRKIKVRDPITCRYSDGYCQTCGGTLTMSFGNVGNIGFLSNVNAGAPVAQQVLSTKHLISTDAAEYEVPGELQDILHSFMNNIFLTPPMRERINGIALGFRPEDLAQLNDLRYHKDTGDIPAKRFTNIKFIYPGIVREDGSVVRNSARIPMGGESKIYPHLSPEVLHVIRNNPDDLSIQDGIAWLYLRNMNPDDPIMQCTVVNNSIKRYVQSFSALVTRDVTRYRSANEFMRDLTELIWERVDTHSTHIACLAKACLITSQSNFHVPVVEDPDNVMFGTLNRNIAMRSIGGLMAFERYNQVTNKPATYIMPRRHTVYDEFMGFSDTIARDANWPEFGNSLEEELYDE